MRNLFLFLTIYLSDFIIVYNCSSNIIYYVFPVCLFHEFCVIKSVYLLHSYNITSYLELNTHFPEPMAYFSFILSIPVSWMFVLFCYFLSYQQEKKF